MGQLVDAILENGIEYNAYPCKRIVYGERKESELRHT
jgi:hypothetical protein